MKRIGSVALTTILVLSVFVFAGNAQAETLTVAGTGASQEMLTQAAKVFMQKNPGVTIEVPDSIGSGGGVKAAGEDQVDLGRVARKIKDKEKGYGLKYLGFAKMPLVFVANPSVKEVDNLTSEQTVGIFTGAIRNWKEVGGPDSRIRVVTRYEGDSTIALIRKTVAGWADLKVTGKSKETKKDSENAMVLKENKDSVGFATLDIANSNGLSVFNLDGTAPDSAAYPMSIEFGLVYHEKNLKGAAKQFVDFLFTEEGKTIIRKLGGVPVIR